MGDPFSNIKKSLKKKILEVYLFPKSEKKCGQGNNPEETSTPRTS